MLDLGTLNGQVLDDKYELESLVGRGGMGAVFRATHLGIKRPVAIKVIAPGFMKNQEISVRFRREAVAAGRILHPNVVNVTDYGIAKIERHRLAFLVMEYLEGISLGNFLKKTGPLPLDLALDIIEQTSLGLGHAHRQGVIHRDLKPDNVWLQPDGRGGYLVKVLDFGLAKLRESNVQELEADPNSTDVSSPDLDDTTVLTVPFAGDTEDMEQTVALSPPDISSFDDGFDDTDSKPGLTQVGSVLGTPLYMSPEQCLGKALDIRSDIYSLGVLSFHMLAGIPPYEGDMAAIISQHTSEEAPPSLLDSRPDVPHSLARQISLAMGKDPATRPGTPESFAATLKLVGEGENPVLQYAVATAKTSQGLFLGTSLIAFAPVTILASLFRLSLPELPSPVSAVTYYLIILLLGLLGSKVATAACAIGVGMIRANPGGKVKQKQILSRVIKHQPLFWSTAIQIVSREVFSFVRFFIPGLKGRSDLTLLPCVVALENLRGHAARKRARDLVSPVRSVASPLRIREIGGILISMSYSMMGVGFAIVYGGSREDIFKLLQSGMETFFSFAGWFILIGTHATLAGVPLAAFYFRSRGAYDGIVSEPAPLNQLQPTKRRWSFRWSKSTLAWLVIPLVMFVTCPVLTIYAGRTVDASGGSLVLAVDGNRGPHVHRLLALGANPNQGRIKGWSALMIAAADGQVEIVQVLLEAGADVQTTDDGKSALVLAAERGYLEVVNILLENDGSDADAGIAVGKALIAATRKGRLEIVGNLLEAGADVAVVDVDGRTALSYATENGHAEIEQLLRNAGAQ